MTDYRIVPVEPTEEMVRQAAAALANAAAPRSRFDPPAHARLAYAAMLSAAPAVGRERLADVVRDAVGHYRMSESMALIVADAILALFGEGE